MDREFWNEMSYKQCLSAEKNIVITSFVYREAIPTKQLATPFKPSYNARHGHFLPAVPLSSKLEINPQY